MCNHPNREAAMVVLYPGTPERQGRDGVWCDPCLAPIVQALNAGGIRTVASCCGHHARIGSIALADGRTIHICPDDRLVGLPLDCTETQRLYAEVAALRAVVEAVRGIHEPDGSGVCPECVVYGPCDTVKAIDATPALSGQPVAQEGEEECSTCGGARDSAPCSLNPDTGWSGHTVAGGPVETGGEGR